MFGKFRDIADDDVVDQIARRAVIHGKLAIRLIDRAVHARLLGCHPVFDQQCRVALSHRPTGLVKNDWQMSGVGEQDDYDAD